MIKSLNNSLDGRNLRRPDNREDSAGIQKLNRFASQGAAVLSSRRLLPLEAAERFFHALRIALQ
jgi:hypothetical protein